MQSLDDVYWFAPKQGPSVPLSVLSHCGLFHPRFCAISPQVPSLHTPVHNVRPLTSSTTGLQKSFGLSQPSSPVSQQASFS